MFENLLQLYRSFCEQGIDDPLGEVLRVADLLSMGALQEVDTAFDDEDAVSIADLAKQRQQGVPLEYILGQAFYWGMVFEVSPETFIPRQETELLVSVALDWIQERMVHQGEISGQALDCPTGMPSGYYPARAEGLEKGEVSGQALDCPTGMPSGYYPARAEGVGKGEVLVVDVGTGCGNIAVALAASSSQVRVYATEVSEGAVQVARRNVVRYNLEDQVTVLCGDLLSPLEGMDGMGSVDLVICNPPYIPSGSLDRLGPEVVGHEPRVALDGGAQGTDLLARLIDGAVDVLRPGGLLVFETGRGPDEHAVRLLSEAGAYRDVTCYESAGQVCAMSAVRV